MHAINKEKINKPTEFESHRVLAAAFDDSVSSSKASILDWIHFIKKLILVYTLIQHKIT